MHSIVKKEENQEEKVRVRKEYGKHGERTQKMMSFRVDNDLIEWLESQPNKGRYINNLIAEDKKKRGA